MCLTTLTKTDPTQSWKAGSGLKITSQESSRIAVRAACSSEDGVQCTAHAHGGKAPHQAGVVLLGRRRRLLVLRRRGSILTILRWVAPLLSIRWRVSTRLLSVPRRTAISALRRVAALLPVSLLAVVNAGVAFFCNGHKRAQRSCHVRPAGSALRSIGWKLAIKASCDRAPTTCGSHKRHHVLYVLGTICARHVNKASRRAGEGSNSLVWGAQRGGVVGKIRSPRSCSQTRLRRTCPETWPYATKLALVCRAGAWAADVRSHSGQSTEHVLHGPRMTGKPGRKGGSLTRAAVVTLGLWISGRRLLCHAVIWPRDPSSRLRRCCCVNRFRTLPHARPSVRSERVLSSSAMLLRQLFHRSPPRVFTERRAWYNEIGRLKAAKNQNIRLMVSP